MEFDNLLNNKNTKELQYLKDKAIECKDYSFCCPNCGMEPPDDGQFENPYEYEVDNERWPKCYNWYSYSTDMGYGTNWTEYHKCNKCKTIYWFSNGT